MSANRFGERFITDRQFIEYAKSLGLDIPFPERLLEFAERHEILVPAARVRFPETVVRRWHRDRYPKELAVEPLEPDGELLNHATTFKKFLSWAMMRHSDPDAPHPLEAIAPEHRQFITTEFSRATFMPWSSFSTKVMLHKGVEIGDGGEQVWTYYHAWHVFRLATFLRSAALVLYDPETDESLESLISAGTEKIYAFQKFDARRDLRKIAKHSRFFEAVSVFDHRRQAALQRFRRDINSIGQLTSVANRAYRKQQQEIARQTADRFSIDAPMLIGFIAVQAELWDAAKQKSPSAVAVEYKTNIQSTIEFIRLLDRRQSFRVINKRVGPLLGYHRPILEEIFPDWLDQQRDLVGGSLRHWILPLVADMPSQLIFGDTDVHVFCDWIEARGFYQFYWHFRRIMDVGVYDDGVSRAANVSEIIGLVSLIEQFANVILSERTPPQQARTLNPKLKAILGPGKLVDDLTEFQGLTQTTEKSLRQQIARIDRIRRGGSRANALKLILRLLVTRNAASHLGLDGFRQEELYGLVRSLLAAALIIWKAR